MNIKAIHPKGKEVSTLTLFKGVDGVTTCIHLSKDAELAKHQSKTHALLVCIDGNVVFENQNGVKEILKQGDYVEIEPFISHWVIGVMDSDLLLIK